jgi:hypothetical protein
MHIERQDESAKYQEEMETCNLLLENYKKIRDQNCDLTLQLAGGETLSVHKAILMGK